MPSAIARDASDVDIDGVEIWRSVCAACAACEMQTAPERGAASAEGLSASRVRPLADSDTRPLEQLCKQDAAFELTAACLLEL